MNQQITERQMDRYVDAMALYVVSLQRTMSEPIIIADYTPDPGTMVGRIRLLNQINHVDDDATDDEASLHECGVDDMTDGASDSDDDDLGECEVCGLVMGEDDEYGVCNECHVVHGVDRCEVCDCLVEGFHEDGRHTTLPEGILENDGTTMLCRECYDRY